MLIVAFIFATHVLELSQWTHNDRTSPTRKLFLCLHRIHKDLCYTKTSLIPPPNTQRPFSLAASPFYIFRSSYAPFSWRAGQSVRPPVRRSSRNRCTSLILATPSLVVIYDYKIDLLTGIGTLLPGAVTLDYAPRVILSNAYSRSVTDLVLSSDLLSDMQMIKQCFSTMKLNKINIKLLFGYYRSPDASLRVLCLHIGRHLVFLLLNIK